MCPIGRVSIVPIHVVICLVRCKLSCLDSQIALRDGGYSGISVSMIWEQVFDRNHSVVQPSTICMGLPQGHFISTAPVSLELYGIVTVEGIYVPGPCSHECILVRLKYDPIPTPCRVALHLYHLVVK